MVTVELVGRVLLIAPETSLWTYITRTPILAASSRSKLAVVSHVSGDFKFGFRIRLLAAVMLLKSVLFGSRFTSPGSYSLSPFRSCQLNTANAVALRLNASA